MRRTHKKNVVYKIASGFSNEILSSQQCNLKTKADFKGSWSSRTNDTKYLTKRYIEDSIQMVRHV